MALFLYLIALIQLNICLMTMLLFPLERLVPFLYLLLLIHLSTYHRHLQLLQLFCHFLTYKPLLNQIPFHVFYQFSLFLLNLSLFLISITNLLLQINIICSVDLNHAFSNPQVFFIVILPKPISIQEALSIPTWRDTTHVEFNDLVSNQNWELVSLPKHEKIIGNKWLHHTKPIVDRTFDKFTSRVIYILCGCKGILTNN